MELVIELIFTPIFGILEAVAGILWPSQDLYVRRLQRVCRMTLMCGVVFAVVAGSLAYFAPGWHVLPLFGIAAVSLIVSGAIGNRIEKLCKKKRSGDA